MLLNPHFISQTSKAHAILYPKQIFFSVQITKLKIHNLASQSGMELNVTLDTMLKFILKTGVKMTV